MERLNLTLLHALYSAKLIILLYCITTFSFYLCFREDGTEFLSNVRSENGVLYIEYAVPENQGVYMCQAPSIYDVRPERIVLTVIAINTPSPDEMPNITLSTDYLKISTGGSGTVDCYPQGYPLPYIRWTKVCI